MDYVVLARKLRPMRFQDLVGQETVARALRNAVLSDRIAHAYLFAGSRGIGKTSAARILTKAINCANPDQGEPCNACENCREITTNAAQDVFEIDAASNRGIDNIRELRENAKYTPTKCTYKTYIIDEVHMLTMESFNALLKTLEEPPARVIFILATTAPHRIPDTILSRCQRYDFPRIPLATMVDYLERVTQTEGLAFGRGGLEVIARNAAGGMRDALTAVDQVVAFAGGSPTDDQISGVLGLMDQREVHTLLGKVLEKSLPDVLQQFGQVVAHGHDLQILLEKILAEVKDMTVFHTLPEASTYFQDHSPAALEFYRAHKGRATLDQLQQLFYLFLDLETQLKQSEFAGACFEMALVKACSVEPLVGVPELLEQVRRISQGGAAMPLPAAQSKPPGSIHPPPQSVGGAGQPQATSREREAQAGSSAPDGAGDDAPADPLPAGNPSTTTVPEPGTVATQPMAAPSPPPPDPTPVMVPPAGPPGGNPADSASRNDDRPLGEPPLAEQAASDAGEGLAGASFVDFDPEQVPPVGSLACEDPRWRAFIEAVAQDRRKLAADLRRAEVEAIEGETVSIVPADGSPVHPADEKDLAGVFLAAFGDSFILKVDRDRNEKARHTHSMVGREQQLELAHVALERRKAVEDEAVQKITQYFPQARVKHARPKDGKRRNDV